MVIIYNVLLHCKQQIINEDKLLYVLILKSTPGCL